MAYKKCELTDPKKVGQYRSYVIGAPNLVQPKPVDRREIQSHGTTMRASFYGVTRHALRPELLDSLATTFQRKRLTEPQLKAAHVKYLSDEGWGRARIARFLEVKIHFVGNVTCYRCSITAASQPKSRRISPVNSTQQ